jgi:CheY-like chemotaxis protein
MSDGKTVLLVEDDESIRETMQVALEMRGYEVITAGNGKEGVDALTSRPRPCLVLLDLMMPVMDGWGFVAAVEHDPLLKRIPVVVVTAFADKAGEIHARSIIPKPIPLEVLYDTVRTYCGDACGATTAARA